MPGRPKDPFPHSVLSPADRSALAKTLRALDARALAARQEFFALRRIQHRALRGDLLAREDLARLGFPPAEPLPLTWTPAPEPDPLPPAE